MPADNQPQVYRLCTVHKHLLSMELHHKMLLALWQRPDVGDVSKMRVLSLDYYLGEPRGRRATQSWQNSPICSQNLNAGCCSSWFVLSGRCPNCPWQWVEGTVSSDCKLRKPKAPQLLCGLMKEDCGKPPTGSWQPSLGWGQVEHRLLPLRKEIEENQRSKLLMTSWSPHSCPPAMGLINYWR